MRSEKKVTTAVMRKLVGDLAAARGQSTQSASNLEFFDLTKRTTLTARLIQPSTAESPQEVAKLKAALMVISSDVPRGNGSVFRIDGKPACDYWLGVIWAIASLAWISGQAIAREWSHRSDRFTEEGFEEAWRGFDPNHPNPVGIASVYKLAQAFGWQGVVPTTDPIAQSMPHEKYKLLSSSEVLSVHPPSWRVKHLLPQQGLAAIFGPSASGKSFLAFDLAACIASGDAWFGHKTLMAPVVYVMLEGQSGIQKRVRAWEQANGKKLPDGFSFVLQPVHLTDTQGVQSLAEVIPQGAVIFIDTLNRAAPTADENSSKDMGAIIEGANMLHRITDGLVVLVHHTGKDTSQGMRGHSSLFAALDGAIEVKRSAVGRSWTTAKAKDGGDGKTMAFTLRAHDIGVDADGDPVTSCTVDSANTSIFVKAPPSHQGPRMALKEIKQAFVAGNQIVTGIKGSPTGTPCMNVEDAVLVVAASLTTIEKHKRTHKARRHIESLTNSGHLGTVMDANRDAWCWVEH